MDTLFYDYENSLIGESKDIGMYNFFGSAAGGANQQRAVACIRYALEEVLGWDVEESIQKFDDYMIKAMKLTRVVDFINYPDEVPDRDPRYILSLLYPERVKMNFLSMVTDLYQKVIEHTEQFPREYFSGTNGFYRYCICLQYLLSNYHPVSSVEELYPFILSPEGTRFLTEYRLKIPADMLNIDILQCLYEITKDEPNAKLFYHFYRFNAEKKQKSLNA